MLATSQLPLGMDGEVVHGLEPLALADSTALFAGRAAQHRHQFVLDEDNAGASSRSSAAHSTGCRWPSSSPPPG